MEERKNVKNINITSEMKSSFLDYAMSVIVSRALPDVRDGLKPVHRRILYAMNDLGMHSDKSYKKSARIVGEVIGKYHPHGDSAVYESMVRMAQDFSYRHMLVDGHGNFGSLDGDGAAAMRYTEARMSKIAMELVKDIQKDTVDFVDNYDGEEREPTVMPAYFPNMLVNGATGIAVGMATNIPPHNLGETIDATIMLMEDPESEVLDLMEVIKGPDFPTGAIIMGRAGIKSAYESGRGSIVIRSKADIIEHESGRKQIIVTEIPYQVNKATMIERIANLVRDKQIDGITDLRDESNREGIRVVIDLRRDTQPEVILNQLYRMSPLQTTFGINMLGLVEGEPQQLGIIETLEVYIDHQKEIVRRRITYELNRALNRAHILEGLRIALDNIDAIIKIIRAAKDDQSAMATMMETFGLSERQARAIMDMRLRRLTGLERDKIETEYEGLLAAIADYRHILEHDYRVIEIVKEQLLDIKQRFDNPRRSEIVDSPADLEDEDLIPVEDVVIALTYNGYIKRTTLDTYQIQHRGGKGVRGMATHSDDVVDEFIFMSTHDHLLMFTNFGKVYRIKGYMVPEASRTAKGIPVVNLLDLDKGETISSMISVADASDYEYLFFVTKNGLVKRVNIDEFESIRVTGKIAIRLNESDELIAVRLTKGDEEIIIAGSNGKAVRFKEDNIRVMGRNAAGVIGFNADGSHVVGMTTDRHGKYLLVITEKGYGKKTEISEYRLTNRGVKGVKTINITNKNGELVALKAVNGDEELLIISDNGQVIRIPVSDIGTYGRNTQGVKCITVADDAVVSSVVIVPKDEEEQDEDQQEHA